jgi:hypothetical protein
VGKKYGSKGYPHTGNAAHMGSISYFKNYRKKKLIYGERVRKEM